MRIDRLVSIEYKFLLKGIFEQIIGTISFASENSVINRHVSTLFNNSMKVDLHFSSVRQLCPLLKPT